MPQKDQSEKRTDTAGVFERVAERLQGDETARTLWQKLQDEMKDGGVSSAR